MRDESIKAEKFVRPAQTCGGSFAGTGNQRDGKEAKMNENHVMNTYSRSDLNFVKGHGPWLTDIHGEEYLDFVSGIAVNCLGHAAPQIVEAIKNQAEELIHVSNLYWNPPMIELADRLCAASGMDRVFFSNSGTEANETALKIARKYGKAKGGERKSKIICMKESFHGRSMGALSVTGQEKYRKDFRPLLGEIYEADFNDAASVKALMNGDVCGVDTWSRFRGKAALFGGSCFSQRGERNVRPI